MYTYKLYKSFNQELKKNWEQVLCNSEHTIYQLYDINKLWFETIGSKEKGTHLNVIVIFFNNEIVGLVPTMVRRKLVVINELVFLGTGLFDYHIILIDNFHSNKEKLSNYIFKTLKSEINVNLISLKNIPARIESFENNYSRYLTKTQSSIALLAVLPPTYQNYFDALKTSIRGDTRRQTKKIENKGELNYNVIEEKVAYKSFISSLIEHKRNRYNKTLVKDIFNNQHYITYFDKLYEICKTENIHASTITINNEPISFHLGFLYNKRYYYYMPSFNEEKWGKYSPSRLHLLKIIEESYKNGIKYFDFTIGDEKYKKYFTNLSVEIYNYLHANSITGKSYLFVNEAFLKLKKRVRKNKLIRKVFFNKWD